MTVADTQSLLRFLKNDRNNLVLIKKDMLEIWAGIYESSFTQLELPVVAVDWSELFAYAAYEQLVAEPDSKEDWSHHYAGLSYLFFKAPCRILLLPPYIEEMKAFLTVVRSGIVTERLAAKSEFPLFRFRSILVEIRSLEATNDDLRRLLSGENVSGSLNEQTKSLLRKVMIKYLPEIFSYLQTATLPFLDALRRVLYGPGQSERVLTLAELEESVGISGRLTPENWMYWFHHMSWSRRGRPRQNRADAVALAFLEQLNFSAYWREIPIFFACRARSMRQIMSYHPASFPPSMAEPENLLSHTSSGVRDWRYFAELAFYQSRLDAGETPVDLGEALGSKIDRISLEIDELEKEGVDEQIYLDIAARYDETSREWEGLRGVFDLQGLGDQANWELLNQVDSDLLIRLVEMLISPSSPQQVSEERHRLANEILERIDDILSSFPESRLGEEIEALLESDFPLESSKGGALSAVLKHLKVGKVISSFLPSEESASARELLAEGNVNATRDKAQKLLAKLAEGQRVSVSSDFWIAALCHFTLANYEDAAYFFANWRSRMRGKITASAALLTIGINVEVLLRLSRQRLALEVVRNPGLDPKQFPDSALVLWNLCQLEFIIDWIEPRQEDYDNFPFDGTGNILEFQLSTCLSWIGEQQRVPTEKWPLVNEDLWRDLALALIYGIARILKNDIRVQESAPAWMSEKWLYLFALTHWLVDEQLAKECGSSGAYRRMGYFFLKCSICGAAVSAFSEQSGLPAVEAQIELRRKAIVYLKQAHSRATEERDSLVAKLALRNIRFLDELSENVG